MDYDLEYFSAIWTIKHYFCRQSDRDRMKIAILGTRGVPNHYGGFEQFAEFFSVYLVEKGHEVYVYNSHNHPHQEKTFHGVHILHQNDPEHKFGTFGQFIYDYNCIMDSRKRNFDIILQLGYTSNSVWCWLLPKKPIIITNMDGLEWKRSKYSAPVRQFLKFAERLAAVSSDYLVADSLGIQSFLKEQYGKKSTYIAYGAYPFDKADEIFLDGYGVEKGKYNMIMARFEPENNLDMVLEGVALDENKTPILVVGNHNTKYGSYLKDKFKDHENVRFVGGIYNLEHLNNLRYFSNLYFHGHSVGGTNPSLLEAMASKALVIAHNNHFNKGVLKENGYYFSNPLEVKNILSTIKKNDNLQMVENNYNAIVNDFNWEKINGEYLQLFERCFSGSEAGK
jgi:glycosyltransferase involved in cell wall biosynthesis